jgi:pimeloyl-ACP methyl ester carboxylesterase
MYSIFRNSIVAGLVVSGALMTGNSAVADSAPKPLPSIVLVHGAFADGSSWDRVIPLLQAKGYNVVAVHEPLTSLADDVAATKRAIDAQPGEVILVGHSYGGAVISDAGNDSKVVALVYVAAFAPDTGESVNDLGKGKPPPTWVTGIRVDGGGFATLAPATILADFAQDLPQSDAKVIAAKQGPIFVKNLDEKVKAAAWHSKPVWYVRASQDRMIDPEGEAHWAKRMKATTISLTTSHVAMLSKPKEVADVILSAATAPSKASTKVAQK